MTALAQARGQWADLLGVDQEMLDGTSRRTVVVHNGQFATYEGLVALQSGQSVVVSVPIGRTEAGATALSACPEEGHVAASRLAAILDLPISRIVGPGWLGYTSAPVERGAPHLQRMSVGNPRLTEFLAGCATADLEAVGISEPAPDVMLFMLANSDEVLGVLHPWGSTGQSVGVLTRPGARSRGLGSRMVADLVAEALTTVTIVQFHTLETNVAARAVAHSTNFQEFGWIVAARFKPDATLTLTEIGTPGRV